jgi:hypothetical protein
MGGLHALTAELHSGFLTLAFFCIIIVAGAQIIVRLRNRMPKRLVHWAIKARGYAEVTSYVAAIGGIAGLIVSAWSGMYAWPIDKLFDNDLIRNKILLTAYATVLWGGVVFIRTRFGRSLWACPAMATVYVAITFVAFGMVAIAGCLGSKIFRDESLLEPLYSLVGLNVDKAFQLDINVAAAVALVSAVALLGSLVLARRKNLDTVRFAPETCQKVFKWDEPAIA